jgi:hypothetical protein
MTILNLILTWGMFTQRFRSKRLCDCCLSSTDHTGPRGEVEVIGNRVIGSVCEGDREGEGDDDTAAT